MTRNSLYSNKLWLIPTLCVALTAAMAALSGCSPDLSDAAELAAFNNAGPIAPPAVEVDPGLRAQVPVGPYRVVAGDLLALEMPDVLRALGESTPEGVVAIRRRVANDGMIRLPGLDDDLMVRGLTVTDIEQLLEEAYAKAVLRRPAVVVHVADYRRVYVSLDGGVIQPGQYELRSDELSLSALLMKAGGISEQGASSITVWPGGGEAGPPLVLPVRDDIVLMQDVVLRGGERVEVTPRAPAVVTVLGQVGAPGRYYVNRTDPMDLINALARARGVREAEDPRYVSVFRRDADGSMVSARFRLNGNKGTTKASLFHDNELGEGAFAQIKPGDLIVVERTARSRARQLFYGVLRVSVGLSASTSATYHEDFQDSGAERGGGSGVEVINQNWPN